MIDVIPIITSTVATIERLNWLDAPLKDTRPARYREVIDRFDRVKAAVTWQPVMM